MKKNSEEKKKRENILYKIFYSNDQGENVLVYLGRTHQPLNNRLRGHFLKAPMMRVLDPRCVTKIEYACFQTEADMFLYEIYFINKWKPPLNVDDKSKEELTVDLPPVPFQEFDCLLLDKWCLIVEEDDRRHQQRQKEKAARAELYHNMRRQIFGDESLSAEEKAERWARWLETVYEPTENGLDMF